MSRLNYIDKIVKLALEIFYLHAKLSPSSSKRWMTCAGSPRLIEQSFVSDLNKLLEKLSDNDLKRISSDKKHVKPLVKKLQGEVKKYAEEGTVAHAICERALTENKEPVEFLGEKIQQGKFTFTVTREMVDACTLYTDYIREQITDRVKLDVEVKCSLKKLNVKDLTGGTSDAKLLCYCNQWVELVDFKYGSGVPVEVEDNPQLMQYAASILIDLEEEGLNIKNWTFILTIIQPRAFHPAGSIRTWKISGEKLKLWIENKLIPCAEETHKPDAALTPTTEGCMFCPVKDCSARYEQVTEAAMLDFDSLDEENITPDLNVMTPEQKLKVLKYSDMIESFLKSIKIQVKNEIDLGSKDYKGSYKLVEANTHRKLNDDAFDEITSPLLDYLKYDDLYEKKFKGVGALETALKDKFREQKIKSFGKKATEILDSITTKPKGEVIIVPESDKRIEVQPSIVSDFIGLEDDDEDSTDFNDVDFS